MGKKKTEEALEAEQVPEIEESAAEEQAPEPAKGEASKKLKLRVTAPAGGFRRGGRRWAGVCEIDAAELTQAQIAAIRNEPRLVVEEI